MSEEKETMHSEADVVQDTNEMLKESTYESEDVSFEESEQLECDKKQEEIYNLQFEKATLEDKLLRMQAELANIQKRQAKERQDLLRYQSQKLATGLLPVLDSLERALAIEVDSVQGEALKKGIEMAYSSFLAAFKEEKIEKIEAMDKSFDPMYHYAVQQVPVQEGQQVDTVVEVLQNGYQLHERVIRPAMVIVSN